MMSADKLKSLISKRGSLRGQVTRFRDFVKSPHVDMGELEVRSKKVEELFNRFDSIQQEIEELDENEIEYREQFEELYYATMGKVRSLQTQTPSIVSEVKLSPLQVPNFAGNIEHWLHFRDTFKSLVDSNPSLSDLQKFHYLLSSLKGEALQLVSSLEVSATNYSIAWDVLSGRYHNKRIITDRHIHALFNMQNMKTENHSCLRKLVDEAQLHLRALEGIGLPTNNWGALMIHLIISKLDSSTRRCWESFSIEGELPTFEELLKCLTERARVLETTSLTRKSENKVRITLHEGTDQMNIKCPVCSKSHKVFECDRFKAQTLEQRYESVKRARICFNCLGNKHTSTNCPSKSSCKVCGRKHNTLLHKGSTANQSNSEEPIQTTHAAHGGAEVLLSTVVVGLQHKGVVHKVRALLDSGSQSNFITRALCEKLKLPQQNVSIPISGIHRQRTTIKHSTNVQICSLHSSYTQQVDCHVLSEITQPLPQSNLDKSWFNLPIELELADPDFYTKAPVDMLLGAQVFWEVLQGDRMQTDQMQPRLQETLFGWVVAGQVPSQALCFNTTSSTHCYVSLNQLHKSIENFWRVEDMPSALVKSKEEILCENHFASTHSRDESGRFVVRLPVKPNQPELGESLQAATKRLHVMERRFKSNPSLHQEYSHFMEEYQSLGHMTKCNPQETESVNYLPHHAVFKEDKIRVVFDGSCKTTNDLSLNNILMTGPVIQNDLLSILIKFRNHVYVMVADIEKMYRQIYVHQEDRKLQKIIWRTTEDEPIKHFELNTVTYGLTPSSFIATRCLKQLSLDFSNTYPSACKVIEDDFYMDDLLTGHESVEECINLKQEVSTILQTAGFNLRKWKSNVPTLSDNENSHHKSLLMEEVHQTKILGLYWNDKKDCLTYKVNNTSNQHVDSKRNVLSDISKTFDPLGLLGPIIIRAKIIMQDLWQNQITWDEPLEPTMKQRWQMYKEDLSNISGFQIPRKVVYPNSEQNQLIGFCDASEKAYGCSVYLRTKDEFGNYHCHLICAKSRVAPLKQLSLPRLELCGAVLLTKLITRIRKSLHMDGSEAILWTDSTIVLHWLSGQPTRWNTFVANRTSEIQTEGRDCVWRHVSSQDNPADIISRGATADQLRKASIWWHGPSWLQHEEASWPHSPFLEPTEVPETRAPVSLISTAKEDWSIFNRYSTFSKLQRVTAYMLRFIHNVKKVQPPLHGQLSVTELNAAHDVLIKNAQEYVFQEEIAALKNNEFVSKQSHIKSLNPFLRDNILYVGGRLSRSDLEESQKHQILLPAHHKLTELIVKQHHYSSLHLGTQALLANIRLKYWPILGRNIVKKIFRTCILCFRYRPHTYNQIMADLPRDRVTAIRPFSICGVDFMGPIHVKSGLNKNARPAKSYVCLFICFATKAIHLELVLTLTSEAFLNSFKRFISRRGKPQKVYSDNGTNFVAASKEITTIYNFLKSSQQEIHNSLANESIDWSFIPPRTPHFGGLWESSVKLVKVHLRKVLQSRLLDYESMHTVITQIEACVNSRPITPLSSDPNDLNPLTPSHFLIGESLLALPERSVLHLPVNRLNHYQALMQMHQTFWKRWHVEYLSELQRRSKWYKGTARSLQPGDLVLIKEDNVPPMTWKLGRVTTVHPGSDDVTRVVSLKTAQGDIKRGISKLCLLPLEESHLSDTT